MIKAAVIGYGSIGERHARWLGELGCDVCVVSQREIPFAKSYRSITEGLKTHQPDYVVIANATGDHQSALETILESGFNKKILVEKPLFKDYSKRLSPQTDSCFVAYNLRLHPLIQRLRQILLTAKVIQVQVYVAKYLPTWRSKDHLSYSGSQSRGGGVLRDLSHELDYLNWLLGGWTALTAVGGHFSHLEIDSDDAFSLLIKTKRCDLVSLQMNYLDRVSRREIMIQCDQQSIKADLITGKLEINDQIESYPIDRNQTYLAQHRAILENHTDLLCTFEDGLDVMEMINAAELSSKEMRWIQK